MSRGDLTVYIVMHNFDMFLNLSCTLELLSYCFVGFEANLTVVGSRSTASGDKSVLCLGWSQQQSALHSPDGHTAAFNI